jgi:hypothetical protein
MILTWVQGRLGLVALHDRVQTTTFFSHFCPKNARFSATSTLKTHVFLPLLPKKRTLFRHFHPKNVRFSATSAQKTHVFQPLLPKKCTFFSHFCPKNARFSATSTQKMYIFQPLLIINLMGRNPILKLDVNIF